MNSSVKIETIHQPIDRGIDFVGHVIKPWRRSTRRRTVSNAIRRVRTAAPEDLMNTTNSYFGLLRQASHSHADRVRLSKAVLQRGKAVNGELTKTYRGTV